MILILHRGKNTHTVHTHCEGMGGVDTKGGTVRILTQRARTVGASEG